jgi:hypothetical protein
MRRWSVSGGIATKRRPHAPRRGSRGGPVATIAAIAATGSSVGRTRRRTPTSRRNSGGLRSAPRPRRRSARRRSLTTGHPRPSRPSPALAAAGW